MLNGSYLLVFGEWRVAIAACLPPRTAAITIFAALSILSMAPDMYTRVMFRACFEVPSFFIAGFLRRPRRRAADFALGYGVVRKLLENLEPVVVLAAVLVDRHPSSVYRRQPGALGPRVPAEAPGLRSHAVRIAIVTDFYYPSLGGITEHVDGQARSLQARGHEVTVVTGRILRTPPVQDDAMPVPEPTFEIARLGAAVPMYVPRWGNNAQTLHTMWPWLGRQLREFFRNRGFDVIHVHAPYNPPFPAWAIGNAPDDAVVVATFHSVFPQTIGMDILAEWTRPWIERLDGRICVSEACIGSLAPYYPYAYDVIPNGIDADHFSPDAEPAPGVRGEGQTIVFVGRVDS